jgi:hypothetical protein
VEDLDGTRDDGGPGDGQVLGSELGPGFGLEGGALARYVVELGLQDGEVDPVELRHWWWLVPPRAGFGDSHRRPRLPIGGEGEQGGLDLLGRPTSQHRDLDGGEQTRGRPAGGGQA